jgi:hypothetical protein
VHTSQRCEFESGEVQEHQKCEDGKSCVGREEEVSNDLRLAVWMWTFLEHLEGMDESAPVARDVLSRSVRRCLRWH